MRLTINEEVKTRDPKDKVYSFEPYAQELYDLYADSFEGKKVISKDMNVGEMCKGEVVSVSNGKVLVQAESSQSVHLDLIKESKFLERQGISSDLLKPGNTIDIMIETNHQGMYSGSMERAFKTRLKQDLYKSMKDQSSAYKVKIKSINEGGFIVDLAGTDCFMPGSLAAANKILNFEAMIGKEVYVMVENYLEKSDMFVVSNKKYIQSVLPTKVKELDFNKQYTGNVTGVMAYGAFIEWDEMFTGLLHETESIDDLKTLKAGTEVTFWIKEIKETKEGKDVRIILSQKGASTENVIYQEFKDKYENEIFDEARVKDVKPFGVFIEMGTVVGMLSPREFKKTGSKAREGEILSVLVKQVDVSAKKIYLRSTTEEETE